MEELKGKVQGFYVERNLNLNVEQKSDNFTQARTNKTNYDREDYEAFIRRSN